ncbi:MAG: alpha/beta hydrolase [Gammaproteobacteria bacterium]
MFDTFKTERYQTGGAELFVRRSGVGQPVVLLHGFPQTSAMWHQVAPSLAEDFEVICPDLRGYGRSSKPPTDEQHTPYSKREMANDIAELMRLLGHERYSVVGHDRGARVAHRLALDHPQHVERLCVMDIVPTLHMFDHTDQAFATGYYHWFFLIQGKGMPEHMIGADPEYYLRMKLGQWSAPDAVFAPEALAEYIEWFSKPETIHAACEDYRAAAGVDLAHDRADRQRRISARLLALWGDKGFVHRTYDVLQVWRDYADEVSGKALSSGHFLPEEDPQGVIDALRSFLNS